MSKWTVVVPGIRWRNWAAFELSEVALTVSIVMRVRLLRISISTRWMMMLLRAVLILSLIAVVGEESCVPSRLMISFLSRRERPFFGVVVAFGAGVGAAGGAGLAKV